ncbi:MAG: efflux RND transporter periplasmic adaptor subunit [Thermodesulfovibrionia bacterium]|nr:efflux RND transporter periplasmic adaptor subunit [Thermodesulfovibrionia bacterium]
MKKILTGIVITIVLGITAFILLKNKDDEPKFRTEKIMRGDVTASVTASGTVNPVTTVLVGTQVSGTVKNIYADFNSPVKKGQLIAQIDPAVFEAQEEQARANLLSAKANLEKSEATLLDAKRIMERNKKLFAENFISKNDLDTSETNYETAKAQVSASKAQVAQAEATLKIAETNLRYTRILSPVDGIVVSRNVDVGQTVAASFQTPTLFTIAQDLTKMQIDTNVDEADIGKVSAGQNVEFNVDAYPDIIFKGKVSQVRNAPITIQNVVTYDVVIKVDNPELKLKPGMTANVSIVLSIKKDVLKISNAALRFSPDAKDKSRAQQKGKGVWIIENKTPKRIPAAVGISDGNYSELLSGEIREGQEIIAESLTKPKENNRPVGPRMF